MLYALGVWLFVPGIFESNYVLGHSIPLFQQFKIILNETFIVHSDIIWNIFFADITIPCYGTCRRRLGHTITLFGQTWSVPMQGVTSIICSSTIDNAHESGHQRHRIAQSSGVLWTVSVFRFDVPSIKCMIL